MQFTINNQTVTISQKQTDIIIHHPVELGGDLYYRFQFSILDKDALQTVRSKNFAEYWWLGTLAMQIRNMASKAKQLQLFK